MPNLPVVDQDGNTFRFYDDLIKGKKVIISFIYTACSQICPLTTSRMAILQEKLGDAVGRDYFMYSITIDPEHDGPSELKKHAEAFNVKPGWRLLTGTPENIAEIRYKLGERSKSLGDHKQEIMLGDDAVGTWSRDSVLGDLDRLVLSIRGMDPDFNLGQGATSSDVTASAEQTVELAPGAALFSRMCTSCHSIGRGVLVGPDLKDVANRRDAEWLKKFISRPDQMFVEKDPTAMALLAEFSVRMPNLGLSDVDAEDVLSYVARRSSLPAGVTAAGAEQVGANEPAAKE
jgi:mono/diheme cytochrome c family protein